MPSVPQLLKTVIFSLGGTDFSMDVLDVTVVPTPGATLSVLTLDGVPHTDVATETWALSVRCIIDWDTVRPGLASYLNTNKGNTVAFLFKATTGAYTTTKPGMQGNVVLQPIPYGGTGNEFAEATVELPLTAAPTVKTS